MTQVLELLADALKDYPAFQPVLLLDTATCHIGDKVAEKAAALNIWLVPVPAGVTHLLQPLDVYTFSCYKEFLRREYRLARAKHGGIITPQTWLRLIFQVCTRYLNSHKWAPACNQVGLGSTAADLSKEIQSLFPNGLPKRASTCLSSAELVRLMPVDRKVRFLHWVRAPAARRRTLTIRTP
jgi:hypothetical protein